MKSKTRFQSLLSLFLLICVLVSCCSVLIACGGGSDDDHHCEHTNTTLVGQKNATCAEDGYTGDLVCTECTAIVTPGSVLQKLEHTYDGGKVTKKPTCMSTGLTTYTCGACGTIKTDTIPTVEHKDEYHDAQDGNHFHTCQQCTLNEKNAHTPKDEGVKYPATCTEGAYVLHTCSACNGQYKSYIEAEPALDHDFGDWVTVDSTCLAEGSKTQTCTRAGCGESNSISIPVSQFCNMQFVGYEDGHGPDCVHDAVAVYCCVDCSAEETKEVPATGVHNYEFVSEEDGYVVKACTVCANTISSFDASNKVTTDVKADKIDKTQALEMNMKEAAIQFPSDVVGAITSGTDLSVSADVLDESAKADAVDKVTDEETKEALAGAPVYDFTVKVDDQPYTENFSTKVAITLSYDNGDNDSEGIVIYYLAENGEIEAITDVVYNAETKEVSFFVDHFSFYAVAYKETQEMRCKRGNHNYVATSEKQTATCYQFGYTLYECTGCHRQTIDDIAEREPHNYGDVIKGVPTCENGAWDTRVCSNEGCNSVIEFKFNGATGHTMDRAASCESASTCTTCGKILARPLGHTWSAWEVVKQPTNTTEGLRRRYCDECGEYVEEILATLGTVEALKFESYSDIVNLVFKDLLNVSNGTVAFVLEVEDQGYMTVNVTVEETKNGFRLALVAEMNKSVIKFYYDNGVFVALNEGSGGMASDVDNIVPMALDAYKAAMEHIYVQLDDYVSAYLKLAREYVAEYKEIYGESINKIFAAVNLEYTVDDIDALIDSVETVYTYLSLKLGYTTSQQMREEVVLPTAKDFEAVLDLLMEATENENGTTYKLTAAPILEFANKLIAFMEETSEKTLAEFIYSVIGEKLKEYNETLTDFDTAFDFITEKFPGTLTVQDAVDMYISFAEKEGLPSIEEVYKIVDALCASYFAQPMDEGEDAEAFSIKAIIEKNGEATLDELVAMMMGDEEATAAGLYASLKDMASKFIVGKMVVYGEMTLEQLAAQLKAMLGAVEVTADLEISVDKDGNILSVICTENLKMPESAEPDAELVDFESFSLTVKRDDSVKVAVPDELKPVMNDVITRYDSDGNLIVEGLDINTKFSIYVEGYGNVDFDDAVTKDATLSKEYGRDVFVLNKEYWSESDNVGHYYLYNGKYYDDYNRNGGYAIIEPTSTFKLSDIAGMITDYLNSNDIKSRGKLGGTDIPVYSLVLGYTSIGIAYKRGDTWMVSSQYGSVYEYDEEKGYEESFFVSGEMTLADFTSSIKLGMTEKQQSSSYYYVYTVNYNGKAYDRLNATVTFANGAGSAKLGCISVDGELVFFDDYKYLHDYTIYSFGEGITELPEHDFSHSHNIKAAILNGKGDIELVSVTEVYLYNKAPTYYVKVNNNGIYANLDSRYLFSTVDVSDKETIKLPDGNTLYIVSTTTDNKYGYEQNYETVYGYVKTVSNMYVEAAALRSEGEVVEVLYRDCSDMASVSFYSIDDIDSYVTRDKGVYKISKDLLAKLKSYCAKDSDYFSLMLTAVADIDGTPIELSYIVDSYMVIPEMDIEDMMGGNYDDEYNFWYEGFGQDYGEHSNYDVVKNADGSITLIFPLDTYVEDIRVPGNTEFPADGLYKKNDKLSQETGLDIYTYAYAYSSTYTKSDTYVYRNNKYYEYTTDYNYDFVLVDDLNFATEWYISDARYRFDMIGSGELPENLSVYETEITFNYENLYRKDPTITLYTFILNGVMNVAVEAEVTGESLLTFERYMPITEYMKSLKFEYAGDTDTYNCYYKGKLTSLYYAEFFIYETTANGNKIDGAKYSVGAEYIKEGSAKKFVRSYRQIDSVIKIYSTPVTVDNSDASLERYEYTAKYYNGTVTLVNFSWEETTEYSKSMNFIKLAGRMYRYDSWWPELNSYQNAKISEWSFNNQALDKVWYYLVVDEENKVYTYYTEFIPSDTGFTPSGETVDESQIVGEEYSSILLGYTKDGLPIYEVAYYITPDDTLTWTEEAQSDGTVFLHKNGTGYLKVTEKYGTYYVKARKVKMADGSEQIYCFLRSGSFTGSEANGYTEGILGRYIKTDGNKLTIKKEFLDVAKCNNRNEFYISVEYYYNNGGWNSINIDFYRLDSLFMVE